MDEPAGFKIIYLFS